MFTHSQSKSPKKFVNTQKEKETLEFLLHEISSSNVKQLWKDSFKMYASFIDRAALELKQIDTDLKEGNNDAASQARQKFTALLSEKASLGKKVHDDIKSILDENTFDSDEHVVAVLKNFLVAFQGLERSIETIQKKMNDLSRPSLTRSR